MSILGFSFSRVLPTRILLSRAVGITLSLLALAFLSACTTSNSSTHVTCPGSTGSYSNTSLPANSQWTYQLSGWFLNNAAAYLPYTAAGVFTADGAGHLTGRDDFFGGTFTGTYSISANGTGSMNITLTSGSNNALTLSWAITLSNTSPGSVYLVEADSGFNASGTAYQQTIAAFNAAPNGAFVFRTHVLAGGTSLAGSRASVGVMTVAAGTVNSLTEDVLLAGILSQPTLTNGIFGVPDSSGTGGLTFADSQGTFSYNYYVIDANTLLLFETDATYGGLGLGRMEAQSGSPFTNSSLTAGTGFAFGSRGDTASSAADGVNSVGQFTVDGAGNITSGSYDTVKDGSAAVGASITSSGSSYSVASNGRTQVTLNVNGGVQQILYLVSGSRGFFLVNDATATSVEDGTLEAQVGSSFTGSNFTGQFAFVMGGSASQAPLDRTGTITSDGNGNLGWAELANSGGTITTPGCLSGTYTVATNGRVAASVTNLSGNIVFYMVSPDKSYVLQGDPSTQMFGGATLQASPVIDPPGGF